MRLHAQLESQLRDVRQQLTATQEKAGEETRAKERAQERCSALEADSSEQQQQLAEQVSQAKEETSSLRQALEKAELVCKEREDNVQSLQVLHPWTHSLPFCHFLNIFLFSPFPRFARVRVFRSLLLLHRGSAIACSRTCR